MKATNVLLGAASYLVAAQLLAGEAVFYITEEGSAVRDLAVSVNGQKKLVGSSGFVTFDIGSGNYRVELSKYGEYLGEFDFSANSNKENAEIQVELIGGEAMADVNLYVPGQEATPALGQLSGFIQSDETGGGVAGASVVVGGTELAIVTDEKGYFSLELPRGDYSLVIAHPNYGKRDVKSVRVMGNVNTGLNMTLSMSGDGMIEEVVAVGSYIPSTATAQQRDSSAVLNAIGAEQMSRLGDTSAAAALKRVAGVTVTGGKYVVARGLNERHTSVILNGSSLPSPDPTRRVVPLDIFPSALIDSIDIQKTFTPDVYADSTGSTVNLKTKKFPSEFEGKISARMTFVEDLTFENRTLQEEESMDILGFGSTGDRELPSVARNFNSDLASSAETNKAAALMPGNLQTEERKVRPDMAFEASAGDTFYQDGDVSAGYKVALRYSNDWGREDRKENTNLISGGGVVPDDAFNAERTTNDINLGIGLTFGLISGNSEYSSNTMLLRQTHSETTVRNGVRGNQDRQAISYEMDWQERQFLIQQFAGEHYIPQLNDTELNWRISYSKAELDNPDRRTYSFEIPGSDTGYQLYWSTLDRYYNELEDTNTDVGFDAETALLMADTYKLSAKYGATLFSRERDSDGTRIGYKSSSATAVDYKDNFSIQDIVNETVANGDTRLENVSSPSDDYTANWDYLSYYLGLSFDQYDYFKLDVGARLEDSEIDVATATLGSGTPVNALLDESDVFASLGATLFLTEAMQIRLAYYQPKNRPDFRELSNAQYTNPDSGETIRGYDRLISSDVDNIDARLEYYFSDSESISLAWFNKDFDNPIEKTLLDGGAVFSYRNGEEGQVSGIELDFRKEFPVNNLNFFVAGNYSIIDSEVTIVGEDRQMQG